MSLIRSTACCVARRWLPRNARATRRMGASPPGASPQVVWKCRPGVLRALAPRCVNPAARTRAVPTTIGIQSAVWGSRDFRGHGVTLAMEGMGGVADRFRRSRLCRYERWLQPARLPAVANGIMGGRQSWLLRRGMLRYL